MLSLAATIEKYVDVVPREEEFYGVYAMSVLYIVDAVGAFDYQALLKGRCKDVSSKLFRLSLHDHVYFGLQLKLFTIRLGMLKTFDNKRFNYLVKEFQISKRDSKLILWLFEECAWFRKAIQGRAKVVPNDCETVTLQGANRMFHRIYEDVDKYAGVITYTKLRFLAKSNNLELSHYRSDLMEKAVKVFRKLLPIINTDEYAINFLKKAVHNHAINMIKSGTTLKRGRLINVGKDAYGHDQFTMHVTSYNQMQKIVDSEGNEVTPEAVDENNTLAKFEVEFSVKEVLTKYKQNDKKYRFLCILVGEEDQEFTEWLRDQGIASPEEDNVDVQVRTGVEEYNRYVAAFLKVTYSKVLKFIESLKNDLPLAV